MLGALAPRAAQADEPLLLDSELSGGVPIAKPQSDWYGVGGSLALGIDKPLASWLSVLARVRVAGFLDGDAPSIPGVRDPGLGALEMGLAGVRLRLPQTGSNKRANGVWIDGAFGGGFTGSDTRLAFEAGLGYGFQLGERTALGPVVRYVQIIQPDTGIAPSDARILLAGVKLMAFDVPGAKPKRVQDAEAALPDRDGDGVLDANDQCIDIAEDLDGYADADGCPEEDVDADSVPDESDACPLIAEDRDGFKDEDGCLDDDNDHDGLLDREDKCPNEPETLNGESDEDGCPDEGLIVMQDDRIVLEERVLFDSARARVKTSANPVLKAIVRLYKQHPEWKRVRIEGHADARGNPQINQELSERRAANVREKLIELGMRPDAIIAEGFGSSRLLTTGTTEEDNRKNRRVEFVVIARFGDDDAKDAAPPAPPPSEEPSPAPAEDVGGAEPSAAPAGADAPQSQPTEGAPQGEPKP